jgi:FkbM family methyltransferase
MMSREILQLPADGFNEMAVCRDGPMLFNRYDTYVGAALRKYGEWSPGELELLRQIVAPGGIVVEGGANIGAHTIGLAKKVGPRGQVHAFEPQRIVFQTLCANVALNSCMNVHAHRAALGEKQGEVVVPWLSPISPENFGGLSLHGASDGERVPLRTIDDCELPACQLIKLDVEGMEIEALRGAANTIRRCRPHLYIENDRKHTATAMMKLLQSWDYDLYWHTPPLFAADNFAGDGENIFGPTVSLNMMGFASELRVSVPGIKPIEKVAQ